MSACHPTATQTRLVSTFLANHTIALAGQPNVGKSTVFNMLTGLNQHVGNWAGKTVEQRTGICHHGGAVLSIVDLPGAYSLTANSQEELIAREYILTQRPDVVAVIVDASILERSLYLVAELMAFAAPLVIGLNMMDVARQQGVIIEPHVLEAALGVPVISMVAANNEGVREFLEAVVDVARGRRTPTPQRPDIRADHQEVLDSVQSLIATYTPDPYPVQWVALKLLEGDSAVTSMIRAVAPAETWQAVQHILRQHEDAALAIAGGRYEWIGRMVRAAVTQPRTGQVTLTERLDQFATHPVIGLAILAAILAAVFGLTYSVGSPLQVWLDEAAIGGLATVAAGALASAPGWLRGMVVDGVIGGAGMVITFLPILVIFFAVMALLEDVGYMARAAYVMDRFMHPMGLHGKSFLPLFLGFGCNVPAVQGARIIEEPRARLLTILLAPLVPCTARMAVVAFIAPIFFGAAAAFVSWGLIMTSLLVLAVVGAVAGRLMTRGQPLAFIMELPLYHRPHLRSIALLVWQRSRAFIARAGTVILVVSVIVWALSQLPGGDIETSFMAAIGRLLSPLGTAMGLEWRLLVALLTSFVAKENSIATLGILLGSGDAQSGLQAALPAVLTAEAALAFLVAQMLFIPCAATVAAVRQETNSWRWTLISVVMLLVISLAAAIAVYQTLQLI